MSDSLTYILGAGASFQSIPIVNTFPGRFGEFISSLENYTNIYDIDSTYKKNLGLLSYRSRVLLKEFEDHQSFDTFFKKLYHTENYHNIRLYKKILNLYFIWEHTNPGYSLNQKINNNTFFKQANVDKRYDALIAGLLKPIKGQKKLFCKTNFITWNYDLNLLSSIKNYFYPTRPFAELIDELGYDKNEWIINDELTVLNMNGFFYSSEFDSLAKIPQTNDFNLFKNKLTAAYLNDSFIDHDAECIKFAWESEDSNIITSKASKIIKESNNVVVVGYTFPLYNRLIDSKYITGDNLRGKQVVIQDPNAEELKSDFMQYFDLQSYLRGIKIKVSCNNFYVPQDIF